MACDACSYHTYCWVTYPSGFRREAVYSIRLLSGFAVVPVLRFEAEYCDAVQVRCYMFPSSYRLKNLGASGMSAS